MKTKIKYNDLCRLQVRRKYLIILIIISIIFSGMSYSKNDEDHDNHDHESHQAEEKKIPTLNQNKKPHDEHEDETEDKGHDDHVNHKEEIHGEESETEGVIALTDDEAKEFNISIERAKLGNMNIYVEVPGEVVLNADNVAHIVPRLSGIVRKVHKSIGDSVKIGEVMAVIDSRELADSKSSYLASKERVNLFQDNFRREEDLWKKKISSEQEYLNSRQDLAESLIENRSAAQKLLALGFSKSEIDQLSNEIDDSFTLYKIIAPFNGTIIEKHISFGEALKDDSDIFLIADLSTVWVNLSVFPKDLDFIKMGQQVIIFFENYLGKIAGEISYLSPRIDESSRTLLARVVLQNKNKSINPGMFVKGKIKIMSVKNQIVIPKDALQTIDEKVGVFVKQRDGFVHKEVEIGQENHNLVQIISGLNLNDQFVSKGAFKLKAKIITGNLKGHAGHGH